MKNLPGIGSVPACIIGGSLNFGNILFSLVLSIFTAINIRAFFKLYKLRSKSIALKASGPLAGFGFIIGFFTVFCALCTIPVISIFGLAIGLGFFTTYNIYFKVISLILMILSLYLLDKQLRSHCSCESKV